MRGAQTLGGVARNCSVVVHSYLAQRYAGDVALFFLDFFFDFFIFLPKISASALGSARSLRFFLPDFLGVLTSSFFGFCLDLEDFELDLGLLWLRFSADVSPDDGCLCVPNAFIE